MRAVLLTLGLLLVASAAPADPVPFACANYDRQIAHYKMMRQRAADLDNDLWKTRLDGQLSNLRKYRLAAGCPDNSNAAEFARQLKFLMELAATGALHYFTMGAM